MCLRRPSDCTHSQTRAKASSQKGRHGGISLWCEQTYFDGLAIVLTNCLVVTTGSTPSGWRVSQSVALLAFLCQFLFLPSVAPRVWVLPLSTAARRARTVRPRNVPDAIYQRRKDQRRKYAKGLSSSLPHRNLTICPAERSRFPWMPGPDLQCRQRRESAPRIHRTENHLSWNKTTFLLIETAWGLARAGADLSAGARRRDHLR